MTNESDFRASIKEFLELLSSKEQQLKYKANVPIADVAAELVCMWFDDMYHPDTDLFKRSFTPKEISQLSTFNSVYDNLANKLPDTLEGYHKSKEWAQIMKHAQQLHSAIQW